MSNNPEGHLPRGSQLYAPCCPLCGRTSNRSNVSNSITPYIFVPIRQPQQQAAVPPNLSRQQNDNRQEANNNQAISVPQENMPGSSARRPITNYVRFNPIMPEASNQAANNRLRQSLAGPWRCPFCLVKVFLRPDTLRHHIRYSHKHQMEEPNDITDGTVEDLLAKK